MVGRAGGRAVRAAASKRVGWLARAPVRRQTGHGDAPTPIVGQKFRVKLDSQKRSISEVLPTVELPSSSTLRSFLVRSLPAEFIGRKWQAFYRSRDIEITRGGAGNTPATHTRAWKRWRRRYRWWLRGMRCCGCGAVGLP